MASCILPPIFEITQWGFSPGWDISREPGSQAPTKSSDSHEIFAAIHAVLAQIWLKGSYFLSNEGILPITHNMQEIFSCHIKKLLGTKLIKSHSKKFIVTERNHLSRAEISCHTKKFLVTRRNFLLQKEISCHRKKFLVSGKNFLS